jgi:Uma2 family endonuclease
MAVTVSPRETRPEVIYPDSDGEPMAENTIQYQYIITIQVGLDAMFADDPDVFVAADLFWYPVEGRRDIKTAPDVMVAFGRPKGDRGSYRQWEEGGIAPQVVFEIISPSNTVAEMRLKRTFYNRYGVEEYYEYDPETGTLDVWLRQAGALQTAFFIDEWRSPRLGVTLKLEAEGELSVYTPRGKKFLRPIETQAQAEQAETRAEQERERAEQAETRAGQAETRVERLAAKLRELGVDPEKING